MNDIKAKALALLNEVLTKKGFGDDCRYAFIEPENDAHEALCRAIERHEAFKQKVSDVITALLDRFLGDSLSQGVINGHLHEFIIPKPKPDPLVEVMKDLSWDEETAAEEWAKDLREALDARGWEIREKGQ